MIPKNTNGQLSSSNKNKNKKERERYEMILKYGQVYYKSEKQKNPGKVREILTRLYFFSIAKRVLVWK